MRRSEPRGGPRSLSQEGHDVEGLPLSSPRQRLSHISVRISKPARRPAAVDGSRKPPPGNGSFAASRPEDAGAGGAERLRCAQEETEAAAAPKSSPGVPRRELAGTTDLEDVADDELLLPGGIAEAMLLRTRGRDGPAEGLGAATTRYSAAKVEDTVVWLKPNGPPTPPTGVAAGRQSDRGGSRASAAGPKTAWAAAPSAAESAVLPCESKAKGSGSMIRAGAQKIDEVQELLVGGDHGCSRGDHDADVEAGGAQSPPTRGRPIRRAADQRGFSGRSDAGPAADDNTRGPRPMIGRGEEAGDETGDESGDGRCPDSLVTMGYCIGIVLATGIVVAFGVLGGRPGSPDALGG